jgi:hypothetical protein
MSVVSLSSEVFARLVGRDSSRRTVLFEVTPELVDQSESNEWRGPVLYRFVRQEGAFVELEFHTVDTSPGATPWAEAEKKGGTPGDTDE